MNCAILHQPDVGSEVWWSQLVQQGTPWLEPADAENYWVTFFWRDPAGTELQSPWQRVWININGVTDHHQHAVPQSLRRIPATDVWFWQTRLPATWRGSYCFMPQQEAHDFAVTDDHKAVDMMAVRHWWQQMFSAAIPDPLNLNHAWRGARGTALSGLHMPLAPPQPYWAPFDWEMTQHLGLQSTLTEYHWLSERLGNERRIWVLTTGSTQPESRPLAILLDGQFWTQTMPVHYPLDQMTQDGLLPPAVYLLIDVVDTRQRSQELTCNPQFWLAVQEELLPLVQRWAPYDPTPQRTIIAGQSFGGLSAAYATLFWPEQFGNALCQSASFWWPERHPDHPDAGWLVRQLAQGLIPSAPHQQRFYIDAGRREKIIHQVNQQFIPLLQARGHHVSYHEIDGGHDALCWRGGLLDGLAALWAPQHTEDQAEYFHPDDNTR